MSTTTNSSREPLVARAYVSPRLCVRGRTFAWGSRTYVMGVINATPDSFSGDGLGANTEAAAALAAQMEADGADIIDIGGESSRPGAAEVEPADELGRLLPCLRAVREATTLPISVDTYHAVVAEAALDAGADMLNDIHGLRGDAAMARLAARRGVPVVAMHNQRGRPFTDVAADIQAGFAETLRLADKAGISPGSIVLDPGFGFGWAPEQNMELLRRLPEADCRFPLLVGTSRKSTLGYILDSPADDRIEGTAATVALAIAGGADIVRVHDVRFMVRLAKVADAVVRANWVHTPELR